MNMPGQRVRRPRAVIFDMDGLMLDTERLATTIWSVRERSAGRRRRVVRHTVSEQFQGAREVVALGTAYAALAAVIAGWVLVTAPPRPAVPTWGAVALTGVAALAFAYPSRAFVAESIAASSASDLTPSLSACSSTSFSSPS